MSFRKKIRGDKAEVWRSAYLKEYAFPEFEGERFIGESYLWCQISEKYDIYAVNEIIYICEYQEDGLTMSGRRLRIHCPNGGMANASVQLKKLYPIIHRVKNGILFNCYRCFTKGKPLIPTKKEEKLLLELTRIPGFILYKRWKKKYDI